MRLSTKQVDFIRNCNHRINILEGSVRSGKTWVSIYKYVKNMMMGKYPLGGELFIIGKTRNSAYRNLIKPMQYMFGSKNVTYNNSDRCSVFGIDNVVMGANDERAEGKIRGVTSSGMLGDELTLWDSKFFKMCLSRLSLEGSSFIGTTNPDSPYHPLKKEFIDRRNDLDLGVFSFNIDDNPFLSKAFVDNLKKEYVGLWYRRFILGLWVLAEGAIYDFFDEDEHTLVKCPTADYYIIGADYGITNPTVYELIGVNRKTRPMAWAEREYYYDSSSTLKKKTDEEYAQDMIDFCEEYIGKNWHYKLKAIYVDPSASSFKEALIRKGLYMVRDADNNVLGRIQLKSKMLKNGLYAVSINCPKYIEEFYGYNWDEKAQLRGEDKPKKERDHAQDAGGYALYSELADDAINYEALTNF